MSYVQDTSTFLKIELARVERERGIISNVKGYGTFLGFDVHNQTTALLMQKWFFRSGIHLLKCGPLSFGIRPSLLLGPKQAAHLRDNLMNYSPNFDKI